MDIENKADRDARLNRQCVRVEDRIDIAALKEVRK